MNTTVVIGLGYVGLPLAVQAAEKGCNVTGVDLNKKLVEQVNAKKSPFANDERFKQALTEVPSERFRAVSSYEAVDNADTIIICVPTPAEDNIPDLEFVLSAARSITQHLKKGQLVVLESTVNPGVTRDNVLPILEESGLVCGQDFYLAHCPERIDPGNSKLYVGNLNRVIGGVTPECTRRAHEFYAQIIDSQLVDLASPEEAEFVKSWENSHRNVMIALANEAAVICDALDMDINNVLAGLQSKVSQFGLKLATPGIGPGGHCIPEDIHYVIKKARQKGVDTRLLDAATDLNDRMPLYAIGQLQSLMKQKGESLRDANVVVLGLAYKENIEDTRRSPAIEVANILVRRAQNVVVHDPYVNLEQVRIKGAQSESDLDKALTGADAVFVATAHDVYKELTPDQLAKYGVRYVLDGRNCLKREQFVGSSVVYHGIGRQALPRVP